MIVNPGSLADQGDTGIGRTAQWLEYLEAAEQAIEKRRKTFKAMTDWDPPY